MLESKDVGSNSENARTRSCGASAGVFVRVYELMTNQILQTRREHCAIQLSQRDWRHCQRLSASKPEARRHVDAKYNTSGNVKDDNSKYCIIAAHSCPWTHFWSSHFLSFICCH